MVRRPPRWVPTGDTRDKIIERFKDVGSGLDILIANPSACAESISLHRACSHAVYYDLSYNCAEYLQSLDRIHRVGGSEHKISFYHHLQYSDTIEPEILRNISEKAARMAEVLDVDFPYCYTDLPDIEEHTYPEARPMNPAPVMAGIRMTNTKYLLETVSSSETLLGSVICDTYSRHALAFPETLSFLTSLGVLQRANDQILHGMHFAEAMDRLAQGPTEYTRFLLELAVKSPSEYGPGTSPNSSGILPDWVNVVHLAAWCQGSQVCSA